MKTNHATLHTFFSRCTSCWYATDGILYVQLTCAIFASFNTFRAFLNGVGVRGDTFNKVLLIRGVRNGSSAELVSSKPGVCRVVFVVLTWVFSLAGVEVWTLLVFTGEFRNCEGENGKDFIGVAPFGLLKEGSVLALWLASVSPDWRWQSRNCYIHVHAQQR